jgi:hypothetical protein
MNLATMYVRENGKLALRLDFASHCDLDTFVVALCDFLNADHVTGKRSEGEQHQFALVRYANCDLLLVKVSPISVWLLTSKESDREVIWSIDDEFQYGLSAVGGYDMRHPFTNTYSNDLERIINVGTNECWREEHLLGESESKDIKDALKSLSTLNDEKLYIFI